MDHKVKIENGKVQDLDKITKVQIESLKVIKRAVEEKKNNGTWFVVLTGIIGIVNFIFAYMNLFIKPVEVLPAILFLVFGFIMAFFVAYYITGRQMLREKLDDLNLIIKQWEEEQKN